MTPSMPEPSYDQTLALTAMLFDAAADVERWPDFLRAFAREFDAFGGHVALSDLRVSRVSFQWIVGLDDETLEKYGSLYRELAVRGDPRSPFWLHDEKHPAFGRFSDEDIHAFMHGRSLHCRMLVSDAEWHASRMYREVCGPAGVEYAIGRMTSLDEDWTASIGLMRRPGDGPFTARDCERLDLWGPHLDRAMHIHRRLTRADYDRKAVFAVLDALNIGVCIVDDLLHVTFANRRARAMLDQSNGVRTVRQRLQLCDRSAQRTLTSAVNRSGDALGKSGSVAVVVDTGTRPAYSLLITPLSERLRNARLAPRDRPSAVILMAPCESAPRIACEHLEHTWRLTRVEARVVQRIVGGDTVADAVRTLGVTVHAVRKHLKAVFAKTGTRSQAELVRLVAGSAAWFGAEPGHSEIF